MRKVSSAVLALSFLASSSQVWAAIVPAIQPAGVFVTTPNPEWSSLHVASQSSTEHRQLHRDMVRMNLDWHTQYEAGKGTPGYDAEYRVFRQQTNKTHRQFHRFMEQGGMPEVMPEEPMPAETTPEPVPPFLPMESSPVNALRTMRMQQTVIPVVVPRTVVSRPSRRIIVGEQQARNFNWMRSH